MLPKPRPRYSMRMPSRSTILGIGSPALSKAASRAAKNALRRAAFVRDFALGRFLVAASFAA